MKRCETNDALSRIQFITVNELKRMENNKITDEIEEKTRWKNERFACFVKNSI